MRQVVAILAAGIAAALAAPAPAAASGGPPSGGVRTIRVSVAAGGAQANSYAFEPAISGNGRYAAYFSDASNLVPDDTNGFADIFLRDRLRRTTTRVSVTSAGGQQTGGGAAAPEISGSGRYVVYWSVASNLVPGDTNDDLDVFRYDRSTGRTQRVSVASDGTQGNGRSGYPGGPDISDNGRYVVFESEASNLVPGDGNGTGLDVFVRDTWTGRTSLVSAASDGTPGDSDSYWPSISSDGRYVAFNSDATNLVPGDTNGTWDIFVRDLKRGRTTRVSVSSRGVQGNNISYPPDISGNGHYVAFFSVASNLVPADTNETWDVFVHDRRTGHTARASVSTTGRQANGESRLPSINHDGTVVVYESDATNLVRPDTNDTTDALLTALPRHRGG